MKKNIFILAIFCSVIICLPCAAQPSGTLINLYEGAAPETESWAHQEGVITTPDGARIIHNVVTPTLEVFVPENPNGTGMLVAPGGGFMFLSYDNEGVNIAKRLNEQGITAFVLKYRTTPFFNEDGSPISNFMELIGAYMRKNIENKGAEGNKNVFAAASEMESISYAYADADRAIEYIRDHFNEYGITKLGMMGFSAGAITTLHQAQFHSEKTRPDFVSIVYGGWDETFIVPEDAMPMYICAPVNDVFSPEDSLRIFLAWRNAGHPVETHFYYACEHGYGASKTNHSVDGWFDSMFAFMRDVDLLK